MFFYIYRVDTRPDPRGGTVLGGAAVLAGAAILICSIIAYAVIGLDLVAAALGQGRYAEERGKGLLVLSLSAALSGLVAWLAWRRFPTGSASIRHRLGWGLASTAAGLLIGSGLVYGPRAIHGVLSDRYSPIGADLFAIVVILAVAVMAVWTWPGRRWLLATIIAIALAGGGFLAMNDMPYPL